MPAARRDALTEPRHKPHLRHVGASRASHGSGGRSGPQAPHVCGGQASSDNRRGGGPFLEAKHPGMLQSASPTSGQFGVRGAWLLPTEPPGTGPGAAPAESHGKGWPRSGSVTCTPFPRRCQSCASPEPVGGWGTAPGPPTPHGTPWQVLFPSQPQPGLGVLQEPQDDWEGMGTSRGCREKPTALRCGGSALPSAGRGRQCSA